MMEKRFGFNASKPANRKAVIDAVKRGTGKTISIYNYSGYCGYDFQGDMESKALLKGSDLETIVAFTEVPNEKLDSLFIVHKDNGTHEEEMKAYILEIFEDLDEKEIGWMEMYEYEDPSEVRKEDKQ